MKLTNTLIVAPTQLELEAISNSIKKHECKTEVCGVGPSYTAMELTSAILRNRPELIILAGIGGLFKGFGKELGDVAVALSETFGDLGRSVQNSIEPIVIGGKPIETHFDLSNHLEALSLSLIFKELKIDSGHMVTVSATSPPEGRNLLGHQSRDYICENMEGAAAAQVCNRFGLLFLEIRGMSNYVGDQNLANWQIDLALKNISKAMTPLLEHIRGI